MNLPYGACLISRPTHTMTAFSILLLLLHYSTVISRLSDQNRILAQRLALLETRVSDPDTGD